MDFGKKAKAKKSKQDFSKFSFRISYLAGIDNLGDKDMNNTVVEVLFPIF